MATHSSILAWRIPRTEEPGKEPGVAESDTTEQLTHRSLYFFILKIFLKIFSIKGIFLALILISPPEISKQKIQFCDFFFFFVASVLMV